MHYLLHHYYVCYRIWGATGKGLGACARLCAGALNEKAKTMHTDVRMAYTFVYRGRRGGEKPAALRGHCRMMMTYNMVQRSCMENVAKSEGNLRSRPSLRFQSLDLFHRVRAVFCSGAFWSPQSGQTITSGWSPTWKTWKSPGIS